MTTPKEVKEIAKKFTYLFVKNFDKDYEEMEDKLRPMFRPKRNGAGELLIY